MERFKLVSNGLIFQWGGGQTSTDIYLPISFPNYKSIDMAIHTGWDPNTTNVITHHSRCHDVNISHFLTSYTTSYVIGILWIAVGY